MKISKLKLIRVAIFLTLILNMIGIVLVFSKVFRNSEGTNFLDFLPAVSTTYDKARNTLFWIAFVLLLSAWFSWELFATIKGKKIFAFLAIILLIIEAIVFLNLFSIIAILAGILLKTYSTIHKHNREKIISENEEFI